MQTYDDWERGLQDNEQCMDRRRYPGGAGKA